ncbi:MAG TPA: tetratricopeptide repeat protein [Candidatus Baltobacteraceae bacterium]
MTRARRFLVAAASLSVAALLFRAQLGAALVVRGDDFLYRSDARQARTYYARALRFDPDSESAADRYVFFGLQVRTHASLDAAIGVASAYLRRHPDDGAILADRALAYLIERRYDKAEPDFERAARASRDPRYFTFAGWAALRAGRESVARDLFDRALTIDPRFRPARYALREVTL